MILEEPCCLINYPFAIILAPFAIELSKVSRGAATVLLTSGRSAREDSREFEARNWRGLETALLTVMEIMSRIADPSDL